MAIWLRIIGISLNALGAIILAVRVKKILDVLIQSQLSHEINFQVLIEKLNGRGQSAPMILGMDHHVTQAQKAGTWLLALGFGCLAVGNILIGVSWYLEA